MTQPLLLLHEHYTPDCIDIWRVAVRRGWRTERVGRHNLAARIDGAELIRYYGNCLHWNQICMQVPIETIDPHPAAITGLSAFTRREIALLRFGELVQPLTARRFIKPVNAKWFQAGVYEIGATLGGTPLLTDWIYVQQPVSYLNEVRCFCLDGQVLTSSLYRVNKVAWDVAGLSEEDLNYDARLIDSPILGMVAEIHRRGLLPRAVVMDFGTHPDGTWSLIEFNEPWCSGLYLCDPERCFDCIIDTQVSTHG